MAITATTGSAANSASAASLALPSFNLTAGQGVIVAVVLGSISSSVTSITDTKGNTYALVVAKNQTNVRIEIWKSLSVGVQVANIITINVSPNTTLAGAAEEYAGISSLGNTGTNGNAGTVNMEVSVVTQDGSNFAVGAFGFAAQSGDTLTALLGTSRQSSIPAATRPGVALYDLSSVVDATITDMARISASREWATAGVELRSGGAAVTATDYGGATVASLDAARDIRYLHVTEPLFEQTQTYPPTPGADNFGFVA